MMKNDSGSNALTNVLLGAILLLLIALVVGAAALPILRANTGAAVLAATMEAEETVAAVRGADTSPSSESENRAIVPANQPAEIVEQPAAPSEQVVTGFDLEEKLIDLYEQVNPSVVFIFTFLEDFPSATGTGFVFDANGHIVTNNHVVQNADRFEVLFPNGSRRAAEVVGMDVDSDLAVIRVDSLPDGVGPLPLGNSREIKVGQFVVAIGNPFGQQSSMSLGIISGLGRSLASQRIAEGGGRYSLPQVIQTDAPINPGNSGGPLLNLNGEVVGINAAIRSETGANTGVGFSIPVNIARKVVPALIEDGAYTYPFLGVSIAPAIDLATQEQLDLPQPNGAYVTTVSPDGPADKAGLIGAGGNNVPGGDLIIAVDGESVNSFEDLISYLVFETEVGQTVTLRVLRGGAEVDVAVTLGARP